MDTDDAGASALQQFCLLAKSTKGAACASLINQALENPSIFVFAELLDMANVQGVIPHPYIPATTMQSWPHLSRPGMCLSAPAHPLHPSFSAIPRL